MSLVEMASQDLRTKSLSSCRVTTFLYKSFRLSTDENVGVFASALVYRESKQ